MFPECSLNVHRMFTESFLNIPWDLQNRHGLLLNVTFAGDILFSGNNNSKNFTGGVNMTGGSLLQDSNDTDLNFGATGLLNVDANNVYTMSFGVATGSVWTMTRRVTAYARMSARNYTFALVT